MASLLWRLSVLLACLATLVSGCTLADKKRLKQCVEPIHPLLKQPDIPSYETCRTITAFIKCVKKRLPLCAAYIKKIRVLEIANGLIQKHCYFQTPTTTATPPTTPPPPPTVHSLFAVCRERFKGTSHNTLREACRSAGVFLKCGESVLWPYDFSVETFDLHAELLRNRAVFWTHCARRSLIRAGVGRNSCPYDVTSQLTSCINITYWQPVVAGDIKTFCRTVPEFLPCLSDLANGCHHVPRLQHLSDFLWNSFDLLSDQCSQFGEVQTGLDYDYDYYSGKQLAAGIPGTETKEKYYDWSKPKTPSPKANAPLRTKQVGSRTTPPSHSKSSYIKPTGSQSLKQPTPSSTKPSKTSFSKASTKPEESQSMKPSLAKFQKPPPESSKTTRAKQPHQVADNDLERQQTPSTFNRQTVPESEEIQPETKTKADTSSHSKSSHGMTVPVDVSSKKIPVGSDSSRANDTKDSVSEKFKSRNEHQTEDSGPNSGPTKENHLNKVPINPKGPSDNSFKAARTEQVAANGDTINPDTVTTDTENSEKVTHNTVNHDTEKQDAVIHDAVTQDKVNNDSVAHDTMSQNRLNHSRVNQDGLGRDNDSKGLQAPSGSSVSATEVAAQSESSHSPRLHSASGDGEGDTEDPNGQASSPEGIRRKGSEKGKDVRTNGTRQQLLMTSVRHDTGISPSAEKQELRVSGVASASEASGGVLPVATPATPATAQGHKSPLLQKLTARVHASVVSPPKTMQPTTSTTVWRKAGSKASSAWDMKGGAAHAPTQSAEVLRTANKTEQQQQNFNPQRLEQTTNSASSEPVHTHVKFSHALTAEADSEEIGRPSLSSHVTGTSNQETSKDGALGPSEVRPSKDDRDFVATRVDINSRVIPEDGDQVAQNPGNSTHHDRQEAATTVSATLKMSAKDRSEADTAKTGSLSPSSDSSRLYTDSSERPPHKSLPTFSYLKHPMQTDVSAHPRGHHDEKTTSSDRTVEALRLPEPSSQSPKPSRTETAATETSPKTLDPTGDKATETSAMGEERRRNVTTIASANETNGVLTASKSSESVYSTGEEGADLEIPNQSLSTEEVDEKYTEKDLLVEENVNKEKGLATVNEENQQRPRQESHKDHAEQEEQTDKDYDELGSEESSTKEAHLEGHSSAAETVTNGSAVKDETVKSTHTHGARSNIDAASTTQPSVAPANNGLRPEAEYHEKIDAGEPLIQESTPRTNSKAPSTKPSTNPAAFHSQAKAEAEAEATSPEVGGLTTTFAGVAETQSKKNGIAVPRPPTSDSGDTPPPWGRDCSRPWDRWGKCTNIMLRFDSNDQCRSLHRYIICLSELWNACRMVPAFNTIPETVDHIISVFDHKCPAYTIPSWPQKAN